MTPRLEALATGRMGLSFTEMGSQGSTGVCRVGARGWGHAFHGWFGT